RFAVRGVVHLEDNVRPGLQQSRLARLEGRGRESRGITDQEFALHRSTVAALPALGSLLLLAADLLGRNERHARLGFLQPRIARLANERDDVMHALTVLGTRFGELYPPVFREMCRN